MGLDMYLTRRTYVQNWTHTPEDEKIKIHLSGNTRDIDIEKITYIIEEAGYWRKANAIHNWFVENCQNGIDECLEYEIDPDKLKELKTLCEQVLKDHDLAQSLLPPTSGFFFGSTETDEWYFEDLEETVKIIDEALALESGEFYYRSSW